jgi:hypothetical protein
MEISEWLAIMGPMLALPVIIIPISLVVAKLGRGYNSLGRAGLTREAQNFAARMCGGLMFRAGLLMLVFTFAGGGIGFAFLESGTALMTIFWIVLAITMILIAIPIILTERAVRRHFDRDGKPYKS